jgi:hypothetical protein
MVEPCAEHRTESDLDLSQALPSLPRTLVLQKSLPHPPMVVKGKPVHTFVPSSSGSR